MSLLSNIWFIGIAIFCLGFSIFIHELGHFIAAKKRGLIADRFSIGFGPRLFGWHWKGTDFRISLLPLGGYVSLPQLADMGLLEGGEGDETEKLPPISYADKVIVAVMGAVFNIILAVAISLVLWGLGREIIKSTEIDFVVPQIVNSEGVLVPGPAHEAGLQAGDTILRVDGQTIGEWMQLNNAIVTGTGRDENGVPTAEIEVLRDEEVRSFSVRPALIKIGIDEIRTIGIDPGTDLIVREVKTDMPAYSAGLLPGDQLHALDGLLIESSAFLDVYLKNHRGGPINLTVNRDGKEVTLPIEPKIAKNETTPRFGFIYSYAAKMERVYMNPIEQITNMAAIMRMTLVALVHKDSDVKPKNMSSVIGIVRGLDRMARQGAVQLLWFLGLINVNLAILNLLPVPVFDGGHILFATISKILRRPLPQKLMASVQFVFVVLIFGFMIYLAYFDTLRIGVDKGLIDSDDKRSTTEPTEQHESE